MKHIQALILKHPKDPSRLLDILRDIQAAHGFVPSKAVAN